jgi:hypothetical protein
MESPAWKAMKAIGRRGKRSNWKKLKELDESKRGEGMTIVDCDTMRGATPSQRFQHAKSITQQRINDVENMISLNIQKLNFVLKKHGIRRTKVLLQTAEPYLFGSALKNPHENCQDCLSIELLEEDRSSLRARLAQLRRRLEDGRVILSRQETIRKCRFCEATFKNLVSRTKHVKKFHAEVASGKAEETAGG